jgi:transcriptional regulator with XRE-family HTH domain
MPKRNQASTDLALRLRRIFARNFKEARKSAGLTQEDLVKMTGLTQAFISNIETGKSTVSLDNAHILSEAVDKTLTELLSPEK